MNKSIFITGATGLVGGNLTAQILRHSPTSHLYLLVRGKSCDDARKRVLATLKTFLPDLDWSTLQDRVTIFCGDVTKTNLGLAPAELSNALQNVTHLIHSAANVQFDTSLEEALSVNYLGTRNVMQFARRALQVGRLQRVAYISTAYTCGNRRGVILEDELDEGQQFTNSYERSKFESERYVRSLMSQLPVTVFRPSIIVGESSTGRTTAFNVLYIPLRLMYRGLLRVVPGFRSIALDVVPVDYVCEAIRHILFETNQGVGLTYHLTAGAQGATKLGEIVDLAAGFFNSVNRRTPIPKVQFVPPSVLRLFMRFVGRGAHKALELMRIFESYMSVNRIFDDSNTRASLKGTAISPPQFRTYYRSILQYSLLCSWGKRMGPITVCQ